MRIAIIGKKEVIAPFRALGLKTFAVQTAEEARQTLLEIAGEGDFAIVFITEALAREIYDLIQDLQEEIYPAITLIPEPTGATGFASQNIREAMLRAVGTDVTQR